ncbi:MAG: AEC family transporter [Methylobacteriaceae bacterium]|jgi:predicted permease|nr:AEC family transporter [Methylobacteriaceae bacterium]
MWIAFEKAVECVLTLLLMGSVGYILARRNIIGPETRKALPQFVVNIALPPFLFYNIVTGFTHDKLIQLFYGCLIPVLSIFLTYGIAWVCAIVFPPPSMRRGAFQVSFGFSNTMFIGLPVSITLFGAQSIPYVLLYYFGNTFFFWTAGNYIISRDSPIHKARIFSFHTIRQMMTPPLFALLLGVPLVFYEVRLPGFIANTVKYLGEMTTALALIFVGVTLSQVKFRELMKPDRDVILGLIGRHLLSPVLVVATLFILRALTPFIAFPPDVADMFIHPPLLMMQVFAIQAGLPLGTMVAVMTAYYRTDKEYASVMVSLSTLLGMISIPLTILVVSHPAFARLVGS